MNDAAGNGADLHAGFKTAGIDFNETSGIWAAPDENEGDAETDAEVDRRDFRGTHELMSMRGRLLDAQILGSTDDEYGDMTDEAGNNTLAAIEFFTTIKANDADSFLSFH